MSSTESKILQVEAPPLRWFTGYYSLSGTGNERSFLQIISSGSQSAPFEIVSVAISTDGTTVEMYTDFSINGYQMTISGVGQVTFAQAQSPGCVSTLTGTINNISVSGTNYLSPVPLESLAGLYKDSSGNVILSITPDSSQLNVMFDYGYGLIPVDQYTYDPTMYLLCFSEYVLMLGTGEGHGLACYVDVIDNSAQNTVLYTIPPPSSSSFTPPSLLRSIHKTR